MESATNDIVEEPQVSRSSVMRVADMGRSRVRDADAVYPRAPWLKVAHPILSDLNRMFTAAPEASESPEAAYLCATASAWSHAGAQDLADAMYRLGLGRDGHCIPLSAHNGALGVDVQAFLCRDADGDIGVLSFRAPDVSQVSPWLLDIDPVLVAMPDGRGEVHAKFLANMLPLWDPIVSLLADARTTVRRLYITGHGIGGALALLTGARLSAYGCVSPSSSRVPRLQGVHTFGQPMAGDAAFAAWSEELVGEVYYRYVYERDDVPRMPRVLNDFQHAGRECVVASGQWQLKPSGGRAPLANLWAVGRDAVAMLRRRLGDRTSAGAFDKDHALDQYLRVSRSAINRGMSFP